MTTLIRDLVHFEEVEEVIKLRKAEQAQEIVEKYVISDGLRRNLLYMFELLGGVTHKSLNVVGNYGTGKSHFLAFVAALLEHPPLRSLVRDTDVKAVAEKLERRYLVVKFELGAAAEVSLRHIFFDQVYNQLLDHYGIEVKQVDLAQDYDNKQNILDILTELKTADPEAGLVVIVDEISDFLKQKSKQEMAYDLALLRELGEVSQESDFLYIGAMQEHVFSDPRYVDQAESIARVSQRFVTVTITKEDVAQVLTNRVVRKDADQRLKLQTLLNDHKQYFTNLATQEERYVDLFPIHPYVIDVFEQLPYFENRGIIGFAVSNVKAILTEPAPRFVTYDRVFDLISATHEIRNLPNVNRVVNVIQTLQAKVDLLDARYRTEAKKLIKALAVLKLLGGNKDNGATSQELANTLFITPPGRLVVEPEMARDNIERIMKNIREVTVGQYINYSQGRYYLDLEKIDDYDAMIEKKAQAAVDKHEINLAFRQIAVTELSQDEAKTLLTGLSVFDDTSPWPSHRTFRPGLLAIGQHSDGANITRGDYRFVLQVPLTGPAGQIRQDEVVLAVEFGTDLIDLLTRARAAELLAREGVHKKIMTDLHKKIAVEFRERYLAQLLTQGHVLHGGHQTPLNDLPTSRPLNTLNDVVEHVKGVLLDQFFSEKYPHYPILRTLITATNIQSEVSRALQALGRATSQTLDLNSRGYLESFGAMRDGHFSASSSPACRLILERVEANDQAGKVTDLDNLVREFERPPWGLPVEWVYLLVGALVFNGYLILVKQGGARLHAGDVVPLLKQGLELFADIRYLERDKDIDAEGLAALFDLLGLPPGLVRDRDSRTEAVKVLHERGQELKARLNTLLRTGWQGILGQMMAYPDLPWPQFQEVAGRLTWLDQPLNEFAAVGAVSHLGKLNTTPDFRQALQTGLADLETLDSFVHDWQDDLGVGLKRLNEALAVLTDIETRLKPGLLIPTEQTASTDLRRIAADSRVIYSEAKLLLKPDQRRPLKGKLAQFQQKYNQLYYGLHARLVGDQAPWTDLTAVRQSSVFQSLNRLKSLPFISGAEFNLLALELQSLEQQRCSQFNAQVLDTFVACPYCRFPENAGRLADLPGRLVVIESRLTELLARWQEQLFKELPGLTYRLPLLLPIHRTLVEELLHRTELPEILSDDLMNALHELTSELQPVELNLTDLAQTLLQQGSALSVDDFRAGLDNYLAKLLKGHDPDLVRIKIVLPDSDT